MQHEIQPSETRADHDVGDYRRDNDDDHDDEVIKELPLKSSKARNGQKVNGHGKDSSLPVEVHSKNGNNVMDDVQIIEDDILEG